MHVIKHLSKMLLGAVCLLTVGSAQAQPADSLSLKWVKAAKRAGMKYIIITSKHHDGFAMYHSHCSDYNIVKCTPFARDPKVELAEACRKD